MSGHIQVAAGIVRNDDGKILIARRGSTRHNPHMWEFPGGKLESGETPADALVRELREEMALEVTDVRPVHTEQEGEICLHFLTSKSVNAPTCLEHDELRFVTIQNICSFSFSPADMRVARMIRLQSCHPDTFLWDYDGTLMDTYPMNVRALCRVSENRGVPQQPERIFCMMMDTQEKCIRTVAGENGWDYEELYRDFRQNFAENYAQPQLLPGVLDALREICRRGGRNILVTHNNMSAAKALENAGVGGCFTGFVTSELGLRRKPDPEMVLYAINKYNLQPDRCVMVGDRPLDTLSGISAGIHSCLVDRAKLFPSAPCDVRLGSAGMIPSCIMGWE